MLRELLRRERPAVVPFDLILRLKQRAPREEFAQVVAEAARLLDTLGNEGPAS
jgi:hypothetical protein